jgi:hypothetical protein
MPSFFWGVVDSYLDPTMPFSKENDQSIAH